MIPAGAVLAFHVKVKVGYESQAIIKSSDQFLAYANGIDVVDGSVLDPSSQGDG